MIEASVLDVNAALLTAMKVQTSGLNTVDLYQSDYDDKKVSQLLITSPFALIHYLGIFPVDSERLQSGETGIVEHRWNMYLGVQNVGGAIPSEKDCIALWEEFRDLVDGGELTVVDTLYTLTLLRGGPLAAEGGKTIYFYQFTIFS